MPRKKAEFIPETKLCEICKQEIIKKPEEKRFDLRRFHKECYRKFSKGFNSSLFTKTNPRPFKEYQ
jgi:hypothetical protein